MSEALTTLLYTIQLCEKPPDLTYSMAVPDPISDGLPHSLLEARDLGRRLSRDAAVSGISLTLNCGDVVGLLGLNGAGKSTTLRMLCGVLVPDEGSVTVNGFSMSDSPLQARQHIGYLPDEPPLYNDMRVKEYLRFAGRIRGLRGHRLNERQQTVTEQCLLQDVDSKLIGTLSKGFRQRVGLAQAMIHQPAVLLLDEPSNGLDPQQLDSMRKLIMEFGRSAAVILSTHLLAEAQAICNRVVIIHAGELVADCPATGADLELIFHGATT